MQGISIKLQSSTGDQEQESRRAIKRMGADPKNSYLARNSLERAITILELVARKPGGLTNAEISRSMHMATSSCSYILNRLERENFLTRGKSTRRYEIGLKIVTLAACALRDLGLRPFAEPALYRLVAKTQLSASVAVLNRGRVWLVDTVDGPGAPIAYLRVGLELPPHATALGKVLLAYLPCQQQFDLLHQLRLSKCTPNTIVCQSKLAEELELVRRQGYALSNEEQFLGVCALAAPIYCVGGAVCGAVSATGDSTNPVWSRPQDIVNLVRETARQISRCAPFLPLLSHAGV
ncbi:MAG: IclR family transcriptional regulator [Candidatus Korobacteraceae bacterium]|jgi:DNA-binding IclR family transcriptional regulator